MQKYINREAPVWIDWIDRIWRALTKFFRPVSPSAHTGMGAIPYEGGVAFRVWAPNADQVSVAGSFNNWSLWRTPLAHESNGYWSVDVPQAQPGDEYQFVIRNRRYTLLRIDPYAREVSTSFQNGVIRNGHFDWGLSPFLLPAWNEMVIYELHVGTFAEKPDGPPGDFQGVIEKLPYLRELGINVIELMPVKEFCGEFSWGYNPAHPFAVSCCYGGTSGLKELVKAAHEQGIAVILDVVYNHFGPENLSLWQFDGWHEHGMGGVYFYNDWRSETPWAHTRPDYGRPEVRQYVRDNVLMWLEEFQVDGLRWDATSYIRNARGHDGDPGANIAEGWQLMQAINAEIGGRQPWKIVIAEDLQGNEWVTEDTGNGGAGFDAQWDSNFVHPVRQAIITARDEDRDIEAVAQAIAFRYNGDVFERVIYTESHDEVANGKARVPEEIAPDDADSLFARKRSTLGAALVFTAPGIPMIFQGQEFLEDGWFDDHRSLDWGKARANAGIVELYRDLIRLRRNGDNNTRGLTGQYVNVYHVNSEDRVIAFHRRYDGGPGDDVVVVANFSHQPREGCSIGFPHAGTWRVRFNSDRKAYDERFGDQPTEDVEAVAGDFDGLPYQGKISIGPYSVVIFSQDRKKRPSTGRQKVRLPGRLIT
ncbi:MAG TPA: alpha-amylase family glycosyl hydrolase [Anaerolineae bacterium]